MDEEELQDDLRVFSGRSVLPPWLRSFPAVYLALALSSLLLLLLSSLALARVSSISSQLQQELLGQNFSDRDSFLFPCGPDSREWEYFAGNCYYFSLARLSWGRARERCRERRAQLVVIGSFPEQQFLMSRTRNERFWIGLTDENSEGKWEWVDGSDYGSAFTFWGDGEPNDSGSNEDCAHLWISGRWNDVRCSFECFFISSGMKPEAAPSCLEQKTPLPKFAVIPDLCSGCGSVIRDRFLLRVNERSWHERCLRCCACGLVLAGNSCFSRECRIYCRHDYLRLFPRRCSRCRGALGGSERIQKVLEFLFHERCPQIPLLSPKFPFLPPKIP
ncbi:hepatic lectin-like isoform X2 [Poecile atricapillus]|uniref:hepatic lectin-like isoform X2 n=1 Tax=Poecile atricapillus TaxID=48891 RepID=UPI00273824AE|nr:hepatic lectin-like isoform X2 [Poecile atricapillus]